MMPATIETTIAAAAHLDSQIAPRETGLEATHERVPRSRSATSRLMAAKIATITKIWDETAARKFVVGSSEIGTVRRRRRPGMLAMIHVLIAALAAVRTMNAVVTARITQTRLLWAHSRSSLRNSGPKPAETVGGDSPGGPGGRRDRGGHAARSLVLTRRRKTSSSPRRTRWFSVTVCPWSAANRVIAAWTAVVASGAIRTR